MAYPNERMGHQKWILNLSLFYHDFLHITIIKYHNVQSLLQFILFLSIGRVYTDSTMRCHQNLNDSWCITCINHDIVSRHRQGKICPLKGLVVALWLRLWHWCHSPVPHGTVWTIQGESSLRPPQQLKKELMGNVHQPGKKSQSQTISPPLLYTCLLS